MPHASKKPSGYNRAMEVACVLTRLPLRIDICDIQYELGLTRHATEAALRRLQKDYRIDYAPGENDMAVGVPRLSWVRLQKEAERYWKQKHGDTDNGI